MGDYYLMILTFTAPQHTAELEVSVSGSVPGKICHTLKCHVQHLSVPLYLPVDAYIKVVYIT